MIFENVENCRETTQFIDFIFYGNLIEISM